MKRIASAGYYKPAINLCPNCSMDKVPGYYSSQHPLLGLGSLLYYVSRWRVEAFYAAADALFSGTFAAFCGGKHQK